MNTLLGAPTLKTRDFSLSAAAHTGFSRLSTHRLSRLISLKPLKSGDLNSSSSSFSRTTKAMTDALNEAMYEQKTVRVRFQVRMEFFNRVRVLLMGGDIYTPLWDIEKAIPMECSEDHIWTVELDLPVGKYFKYIYFYRANNWGGVICGFRYIRTWETRNTIVVSDDWKNCEIQKISEEHMDAAARVSYNQAITDALNEGKNETKTVHVKFQLQKECLSSDRILLTGYTLNKSISVEIPMVWSLDHIWTAELELPVGKFFEFEFIVEDKAGDKLWQPEPERIIKPWETRNTILVSEDWENAKLQKISEEPSEHLNASEVRKVSKEPSKDLKDGPDKHMDAVENIPHMGATRVSDNQVEAVTEDVTFPREEDKSAYLKEKASTSTNKGITTKNKANKIKKPSIKPKEGSLVAEDIIGTAGIVSTEKNLGETRMTEEVFSAKPESKKVFEASFGNDEAEDPDVPEVTVS